MDYKQEGSKLRTEFKNLIYNFMKNSAECQKYAEGLKQSEIFRNCGMDWGEKQNATSTNQQYWIVALLRELEEENKIQRDCVNKKWRLK